MSRFKTHARLSLLITGVGLVLMVMMVFVGDEPVGIPVLLGVVGMIWGHPVVYALAQWLTTRAVEQLHPFGAVSVGHRYEIIRLPIRDADPPKHISRSLMDASSEPASLRLGM